MKTNIEFDMAAYWEDRTRKRPAQFKRLGLAPKTTIVTIKTTQK
jgi:hypothetical protein